MYCQKNRRDNCVFGIRRRDFCADGFVRGCCRAYKKFEKLCYSGKNSCLKSIEKIKEEYDILDFFESVQENPRIFEKFLPSKDAEKIVKIFSDKREKDKFVEKKFFLKSLEENGVEDIRHILDVNAEIHYLGSS